jgi:hypothetical protein
MISYIILFSYIALICAYEPSCTSCKNFIPHFKNNHDLGLCKMFKNTPYPDTNILTSNFAIHCRNDENLCGKSGFLYEPDSEIIQENFYNDYEELNNRCCGEVNEKYEIDELDKELFELFQKIKKHNTKRIYKSTKDLYKLFKKK